MLSCALSVARKIQPNVSRSLSAQREIDQVKIVFFDDEILDHKDANAMHCGIFHSPNKRTIYIVKKTQADFIVRLAFLSEEIPQSLELTTLNKIFMSSFL